MMKRGYLAIASTLALSLGLAACDGSPGGSGAPAAVASHDPMEAKIDALSPSLQETTMFRAIQDGGYTCQKIVRMAKHAPIEGRAVWVAECDDKGQYVITLQPGGIFWVSGVPQPKKH